MVGKALETICAFANTEGRVLVLGVGDPATGGGSARLHGVQENPEAVDELRRKTLTQLNPAFERLHWMRLPCTAKYRRTRRRGAVARGEERDKVHSIVDDGTWTRMSASNREMNAAEIADLHYRAACSAVSERAGGAGVAGDGCLAPLCRRARARPAASPSSCSASAWPSR
ncbi:MAG: putative DNA binding domain-containing protein [Sulfuritalea sp.]|nr:putative DNA binding domain-containing protein [Sulfuritalea sp.]